MSVTSSSPARASAQTRAAMLTAEPTGPSPLSTVSPAWMPIPTRSGWTGSWVVDDAVAASLTFNRLIQGFMGLGLVVGVAALGVISARAVVERRQQIGVMRAIGFRRRMVQAAFLLESSFVALTAILVGTALGLLLAWNIIRDTRSQPSWENLELVVPWLNLGVIFLVVYAVALAATLAPAVRASKIRPAEALRYQ